MYKIKVIILIIEKLKNESKFSLLCLYPKENGEEGKSIQIITSDSTVFQRNYDH